MVLKSSKTVIYLDLNNESKHLLSRVVYKEEMCHLTTFLRPHLTKNTHMMHTPESNEYREKTILKPL